MTQSSFKENLNLILDPAITLIPPGIDFIPGGLSNIGDLAGLFLNNFNNLGHFIVHHERHFQRNLDVLSDLHIDLLNDLVDQGRSLDLSELGFVFLNDWGRLLLDIPTEIGNLPTEDLDFASS